VQSLEECVSFVNTQSERLRRLAVRYPRRANLVAVADKFDRVAQLLGSISPDQITLRKQADAIALRPEDVLGLPEELLAQLSLTPGDKQDFEIAEIVRKAGGVLSLDHILIALYRKTGEIHERTKLNSRLYRMTTKDLLYPVPGKKGVYSIHRITEDPEEASESE
jgi:hypothetical protein